MTFSACPEHSLIFITVLIGILHCYLRFANASQATHGMTLGERRCMVCFEMSVQLGKDLSAASEEVVAQVRDVPWLLWLCRRWCCFILGSIEVLVYRGIIANDLALHCLIVYL